MFNYDNQQERLTEKKGESWLRGVVRIFLRDIESSPRVMWDVLTNKNARFSREKLCISCKYERNEDGSRHTMQPVLSTK